MPDRSFTRGWRFERHKQVPAKVPSNVGDPNVGDPNGRDGSILTRVLSFSEDTEEEEVVEKSSAMSLGRPFFYGMALGDQELLLRGYKPSLLSDM